MASLANQTISSTYDGLVKTSTDQPVPISGVQLLEDGVGNSLALSVGRANQGVTITGTLSATSISGVLADGVTATTQTSGDNSTKVATTAYVDAATPEVDLDLAGDSGTGTVDLATQSLTIAGTANEIETSASGQTITIGLPSGVTVGTLTATTLAGTLSTAAQTNITSVGTLSSLAVSGNLTVDTNTLFVDAASNRVGIGTSSPSVKLDVDGAGKFSGNIESTSLTASIIAGRTTGTGYFGNITGGAFLVVYGDSHATKANEADISAAGGINILNNVKFPNGNGIDFSASAGGGATSSLLDDYEEGTFTPSVVYSTSGTPTYANRLGRYTKVGRMVQVQIYVSFNENGAIGLVSIEGLPFTSVNSLARAIPSIFSFGLTGLPTAVSITGILVANTTTINLYLNNNAATDLSDTYTDNDQDILLTLTYEAA